MSNELQHAIELRIATDHPALAGHFPGRPIVPGVLLLDCVLAEAERCMRTKFRVTALQQAKFLAPLLPEVTAVINFELSQHTLKFTVVHNETTMAQGKFAVSAA